MSMTHLDPNSEAYRSRCGTPVGGGRIPTEEEQGAVECWRFNECGNLIRREVDDFDADTRRTSWTIVEGSGAECACGNFMCTETNCGHWQLGVCKECADEASKEFGIR